CARLIRIYYYGGGAMDYW
nr:immunoglobulin heavy chain junction region [Mus musculus]